MYNELFSWLHACEWVAEPKFGATFVCKREKSHENVTGRELVQEYIWELVQEYILLPFIFWGTIEERKSRVPGGTAG